MAKTLLFLTFIFLSSSMIFSQKFLGEKTDMLLCISDMTKLKTELQLFLAKNITIEELIQKFKILEPIIDSTLFNCGIADVSLKNITYLSSEKIPLSIDFLACLSDLKTIVTLISELIDVETGNIITVLRDLNEVRAAVVALTADCSISNSTNLMGRALIETKDVSVGTLGCLSEITEHFVPDLKAFVNVSTSGRIEDIIATLNVIMGDINTVVADCHLADSEEFKVVLKNLSTISPIECLLDIRSLVNLAETIVQNFNNSQYEELISNINQLFNEVQQTITDCTGSNVTLNEKKYFTQSNLQTIECANEFNNFVKELRILIIEEKFEKLLQTENLFESFRKLIQACGIQDIPLLKRIVSINFFACVQDIENLLKITFEILNAAENYNITDMITDLEHFIVVFEAATADCTSSNITIREKLTINVFKCINDVKRESEEINSLIGSISAENITDILSRIINIVNGVDPFLEDCGLNKTIVVSAKRVKINPGDSFNDISDIVNVLKEINVDYRRQNWSQLAQNVFYAVESVQQLVFDCFSFNSTI